MAHAAAAAVPIQSSERDEAPRPELAAPLARKPSFWDAFSSPRLALMIGLGFAAGLPNPLSSGTLTAWLASEHVSLSMIGFAALFSIPYSLKFLWAPFLDRVTPPLFGRRRGWMLIAQFSLVIAIGVMGTLDPTTELTWVGVLALAIAFFSATQDIAVDAYRTDVLAPEQRASGTAIFVAAYRGALIVATALALIVADHASWRAAYWMIAALMGVGIVTTFIAPAPASDETAPRSLREAVVAPLSEFLRRKGSLVLLAIILLYKLGDEVAGQFQAPFLLSAGFSLTEIGAVTKGFGLGATIVGALLGGGLVSRWGLKRSLIVFGIAQAIANLSYAGLALVGKDYVVMTAAIGVDKLMTGLGTAAFVAFLMTLCNKRFTAFQYALFSSFMTLPGRLLGYFGGDLAEHVGWAQFFIWSIVAAAPAIVLLCIVEIRDPNEPAAS